MLKELNLGVQFKDMLKGIMLFLIAAFCFQCSKDLEEGDPSDIPANLTTISQGSFVSAAHPTSGSVKLAKDSQNKKYLVFENFKTDSGPDIRIWLATDKSGQTYTELLGSVPVGTYKVDVPSNVDTEAQKHVLIWCKKFTVLFGSAELK